HPHVRGAHELEADADELVAGPSPRAWGSQKSPMNCGNASRVHPHVRGAHPRLRGLRCLALGPSPRAWGSLRVLRAATAGTRSIPTCVGLTWAAKRVGCYPAV